VIVFDAAAGLVLLVCVLAALVFGFAACIWVVNRADRPARCPHCGARL
jgi:hypothetical protein